MFFGEGVVVSSCSIVLIVEICLVEYCTNAWREIRCVAIRVDISEDAVCMWRIRSEQAMEVTIEMAVSTIVPSRRGL